MWVKFQENQVNNKVDQFKIHVHYHVNQEIFIKIRFKK